MHGGLKTELKCYLCDGTSKDMIQYDEQSGICQPCYNQQKEDAKYYKSLKTTFFPEIDQITDHIYLGNQDAAINQDILKEKGITAICVCGSLLQTPFEKNENYVYKKYEIQDFPRQKIFQYFDDHFQWMNKMIHQKRKILIHCAAGVSRSSSFTIAFLMKKNGWEFQKSKDYVKSKRPCINPNSGFRQQLKEYEAVLKSQQ